jgi:nitroimidazol reductase NimA-like FMN-containing flavoprotein (pyridoxamine 5'-phosphate oxidase superfamily)
MTHGRGRSAGAATLPPREDGGHGVRKMSTEETRDFLATQEWGVLAMSTADGPYAVPVSYGLLGDSLVVMTGSGRKLDAIQRDPRVCLTVTEVRSGAEWRCVVVRGTLREVDGVLGRARAVRSIGRHRTGGLTAADALRAALATVFILDPAELAGRHR